MSSKNPVVSKDRLSNYPNWTVYLDICMEETEINLTPQIEKHGERLQK